MTAACAAVDLEPIADAITVVAACAMFAFITWVFFR